MENGKGSYKLFLILSMLVILISTNILFLSVHSDDFNIDVHSFLPDNSYPWPMFKYDDGNTFHTPSRIPRFPKQVFETNTSANILGHLGFPLTDGEVVIVGGAGEIAAYDPKDGGLIWSKSMYDEFGASLVSYAIGDKLYIATAGRFDIHGESIPALLIALDKYTGKLVWKVEIGSNQSFVTSNLIIYRDRLFFGTIWGESRVYSYSLDGDVIWISPNIDVGNVRGVVAAGEVIVATGENTNRVVGLNFKDGSIKWVYNHGAGPGTPLYWNGKIYFIDSVGNLVCLDASNGELIFTKEVHGVTDVDTNSKMAIDEDGNLYVVTYKEGMRLTKVNSDGDIVNEVKIPEGDMARFPVVGDRVVILPVSGSGKVFLYFFWDDLRLINTLTWESEETFTPSVTIWNASIYMVYTYRFPERLVRLVDLTPPSIKDVAYPDRAYIDQDVVVNATLIDNMSAIYRAILFYRLNGGEIKHIDMDVARRYVVEPAGGYGLKEEPYTVTIPKTLEEGTLEFRILVIDNSGNYVISDIYRVNIQPRPPALPPIWIIAAVAALIAILAYILITRFRG